MRIGILTARTADYYPNRRLLEAADKLGQRLCLIHPKDCLSGISHEGLEVGGLSGDQEIGVLLPRIGATINDYALTLVHHFECTGLPVVNGFHAILLARNKFLTLQTLAHKGLPVPRTFFASNIENFRKAVEKLGGYPVVAKTPNSRQGSGVVLVDSPITGDFIMHNLPNERQGLLVQEFIGPGERTDLRAFVLGGEVVAAMELEPREGDFRSNIHLKGRGRAVILDRERRELAVGASEALNLEISGVDIVATPGAPAKVMEVNYTPGFRGLEASTGLDVASCMIRFVRRNYGGTP